MSRKEDNDLSEYEEIAASSMSLHNAPTPNLPKPTQAAPAYKNSDVRQRKGANVKGAEAREQNGQRIVHLTREVTVAGPSPDRAALLAFFVIAFASLFTLWLCIPDQFLWT